MKITRRNALYLGAIFSFVIVIYSAWNLLSKIYFYQEAPEHWQPMALPELQSPLVLRAVYVENPRFKSLSDFQIEQILNKTSNLVSQHLHVDVQFEQKKN